MDNVCNTIPRGYNAGSSLLRCDDARAVLGAGPLLLVVFERAGVRLHYGVSIWIAPYLLGQHAHDSLLPLLGQHAHRFPKPHQVNLVVDTLASARREIGAMLRVLGLFGAVTTGLLLVAESVATAARNWSRRNYEQQFSGSIMRKSKEETLIDLKDD